MKKLTIVIVTAILISSASSSLAADYDPQHTMLALNMAIVSVNRILTTESRAVLEEEYSNIINNLSLGSIESDKDMTELYRDMLSIISRKRIAEEASKRLKSYYDTAEQRRIIYALSNVQLAESKLRALQREASETSNEISRIQSKQSDVTYSWLGNMAMSCVSLFTGNVFAVGDMLFDSAEAYEENRRLNDKKERAERLYHRTKDEEEQNRIRLSRLKEEMKQDEKMMQEELKLSQWQLERQDIIDCNALQERLLQSSWNLLRQYKLPDEYRLTQNSLKNFYRAVQEKDLSRRSRMLRVLEDEFRVYPPYWYFRAKTAQESGNLSEAHEFFAKFNEVWRPVLRRDPYKLEAAKFRIQEIAAEGKPIDETRNEILEQLEIVYANTPKDDWADNLFLGVAYFLMGDKSKGMDCIAVNLDFGYEDKISGMLFSQMEKGALDSQEAQNEINRMKLAGLITAMNISDSDTAMLMAMFFEGNNDALESINGRSDNPVVFHALRLIEQSKGNAQNYAKVMEYVRRHDALKDKIHASYSEISPLVEKYVKENRDNAKIFMADMLMFGWGVQQDKKRAEKIFTELAEKGNVYAQFVMIQSHLSPVAPVEPPKPTLSREQLEDLYQLGENYYYGRGGIMNHKKAFEYYMKAAQEGHAESQYSIGFMYRYGEGISKDLRKAREWYEKAAAQGHTKARKELNNMPPSAPVEPPKSTLSREQLEDLYQQGEKYYYGRRVTLSRKRAFEYYMQAAYGGHAKAQFMVGHMYRYGQFVSEDLQKARYWYQKAADQGDEPARRALYTLNKNGR